MDNYSPNIPLQYGEKIKGTVYERLFALATAQEDIFVRNNAVNSLTFIISNMDSIKEEDAAKNRLNYLSLNLILFEQRRVIVDPVEFIEHTKGIYIQGLERYISEAMAIADCRLTEQGLLSRLSEIKSKKSKF